MLIALVNSQDVVGCFGESCFSLLLLIQSEEEKGGLRVKNNNNNKLPIMTHKNINVNCTVTCNPLDYINIRKINMESD